jgi:hypothetical protein
MIAEEFIARLEGVKPRAPGRWSAKCPAHDDSSPSLSVLDTEDRVLVHCFAGCDPFDVCEAIGVELRDLFRRDARRRRNDEVRDEMRRRISARDALEALDHEISVVTYIALDLIEHREIEPDTWHRLATAHRRISNARALIAPARLPR